MIRSITLVCVCYLFAASWSFRVAAAVVRVPMDVATIQAALDSISSRDTVLVALGTYAEALQAPPIIFTLMGDVTPDTGEYERPTVDPSLIADNWLRPCMRLPNGAQPRVVDMRFANRLHEPLLSDVGGVHSLAASVHFERCLFDSLIRGFYQPNHSTCFGRFIDCRFRGDSAQALFAPSSIVNAENCFFSGIAAPLVSCGRSSSLQACHFTGGVNEMLSASGTGIFIRDCLFDNGGPFFFGVVNLNHFAGDFSGNVFANLQVGQGVLIIEPDTLQTATISRNMFMFCRRTHLGVSSPMIAVYAQNDLHTATGVIEHNSIVACSSSIGCKAVYLNRGGTASENYIAHNNPQNIPALQVFQSDSTTLRRNRFIHNGYGVHALNAHIDARFNYWGDSTGPYHPTLNPDGQGDQVGDNILFDPWYPDTNFLATPEPREPLPALFSLTVYPNPFNAQATLRFDIPDAGIYSIALFDVLGRQVRELFRGPALDRETIHFNSEQLSSGIYFARAWDIIERRPLATAKLVLLR